MNYYEHNLNTLEQYRSGFLKLYKKQEMYMTEENYQIRSIPTKTTEYALEVTKEGTVYRLNSKYDPIREARTWADQFTAKNLDTVFVLFGLGNGIFARELANKMEDNKLIIYEPSMDIFQHVLSEYSLVDLFANKRVMLIVKGLNDYEYPLLISEHLNWINLFSQIKCVHPGYDKLFPETFQYFDNTLQDNTFNNVIAKNTFEYLGKSVFENVIDHIKYLKDSITIWDLMKRIPKEIPAIIVAAGPSLNKNIEVLKQAKGKSIIFAVDRAYETLLEHNIEPDMVVLLDSAKALKYCGNQKGFKTPLLCCLEGSPEIMNNHDGTKIIYACEEYVRNIYKELKKPFKKIGLGGSVTTAAFAVTLSMNFSHIVFIGLDLAFSGGLTHAGSHQETNTEKRRSIELYVEDIEGNTVKTRHDWYTFIRWFENVILQITGNEYDIIDATEGGAKVKGTRIMKLQEVVDQYCVKEFDFKDIINNTKPTFTEKEYEYIYKYLNKGNDELVKIKRYARMAANECSKLLSVMDTDNYDEDAAHKVIVKISSINKKIEGTSLYSLINQYLLSVQTDEIGALYFLTTNKKTDDYISFEKSRRIYASVIEACDIIKPKIKSAMKSFEIRIS